MLVCFNKADGAIQWSVDVLTEFKGQKLTWGLGEAVLIVDGKVICTPGGPDATVVALDKLSGKTVWTSKGLSDQAGYCSALLIERWGSKISPG